MSVNEIWIYDEIGPDYWGLVSAKSIIDQLKAFGGEADVTVRMNSPGGSVIEGQAIYNALLRHKGKVSIEVDSLAASMGSYITMAGDEIRIAENAMIMIHNPWSIAIGDAAEMRKTADVLEKFQGTSAEVYAKRSGQTVEKVAEMMAAETWLTGKEAVELGFADEIGTPMNVSASIKPGRYMKTPERFLVSQLPREQKRSRQIEQVSAQIRLSRSRLGV